MNTQKGIVGFFDILGYQSLLEKNEPEEIAETVLPFLTGIKSEVLDDLKTWNISYKEELIIIVRDYIKWLVFSDTILLTMPIQESDRNINLILWGIFFTVSKRLQTKMFRNGLPLRAAISYGKFYIKDTCFAGRTIIEAYQLCNQLEFAACVLTESCSKELENCDIKKSFNNKDVFDYLVPKKDGESRMLTLAAYVYNTEKENLRTQVLESFLGHNKDIPISAQKKITNTEQWLEFLRLKKTTE